MGSVHTILPTWDALMSQLSLLMIFTCFAGVLRIIRNVIAYALHITTIKRAVDSVDFLNVFFWN